MNKTFGMSFVLGVILSTTAIASFDELPEQARKTLDDGKLPISIRQTWQEFHDKYATTTSGETEKADREQKWATLDAYAKQFWTIQKAMKVGESLHEYPGILGHGVIHWESQTKSYELVLGLRPFDAGDGLGQFTVTFDMKGIITGIRVHKYPW
jgi:hypothetical protein